MQLRRSQRPPASLILCSGRRQPQRMLGELRGERRRAAPRRGPRGLVHYCGHVRVRSGRREAEMPRAVEWVVHDLSDSPVDASPFVPELRIEEGREQRVTEAKRVAFAFDHVRDNGRIERVRIDAGPLEQRGRGSPECGCESERLARRRGKAGEARTQEPLERLRDGKRLCRVDLEAEGTPELERVERIATRALVDPEQRLTREGPIHSVAQKPVQRADAQRPERQPLDVLLRERLLDLRRLCAVCAAPCEEKAHPACIEPPQSERQRVGRGRVEPLQVVDRDNRRVPLREHLEPVANGEP